MLGKILSNLNEGKEIFSQELKTMGRAILGMIV